MGDKLKPCPFCGGQGKLDTWAIREGDYSVKVRCTTCEASGPAFAETWANPERAVPAWNRRAPSGDREGIAEHNSQIK
jgi:Lar family restriction alleviation protein